MLNRLSMLVVASLLINTPLVMAQEKIKLDAQLHLARANGAELPLFGDGIFFLGLLLERKTK